MLRKPAAIAAAIFLVSTVAKAEPADGWSGFSVALGGGAGKIDQDAKVDSAVSNDISLSVPRVVSLLLDGQANNTTALGNDDWAGFGTAQLAFDQRFGNLLVGALVDFDFYPDDPGGRASSSFDGSLTLSGSINNVPFAPLSAPIPGYASVKSDIELDNVWSVGGRIGYIVTPSALIYGLGGYTEASIDGSATLSFNTILPGPNTLQVSMPDELHGFFIGGGGEYKFTDNLALRLEYRYARYRGESSSNSYSNSFNINDPLFKFSIEDTASLKADVDAEIHTIRGALVMKLGMP